MDAAPMRVLTTCTIGHGDDDAQYMAWTTYVEEVQLIGVGSSNAVCKQQEVALQPFDFKGRKLKADTGTCFVAHVDMKYVVSSIWLSYVMTLRA
jgi:hypothetical protein